jgi:transaldolase
MDPIQTLGNRVHEFIRQNIDSEADTMPVVPQSSRDWQKVREAGCSLWLDTGDIEEASRLWVTEFEALTTNNTLLNREVQKGIYDNLIPRAVDTLRSELPEISETELLREVAFILNAWHGLRLVRTFNSNVSVELHTDLAHNLEGTVEYGKRFYAVCPKKFIIKVPLTASGFLAARKLRQQGIPINFTLGFSVRQNYLAALLTGPNYVNIFLGRLNAFVSGHKLGDGKNIGEKVSLATQRMLNDLAAGNRSSTRLIGASLRNGAQVSAIAGVNVLTMPTGVVEDYNDTPPASVENQVHHDPPVTFFEGITEGDFYGSSLWNVTDSFRQAVDELLTRDVDGMSGNDLKMFFQEAGESDILPELSSREQAFIAETGKIPDYQHWRDKLKNKEVGLDTLMNVSGFHSFCGDQAELDSRIRSML